jgi:hypothetical protein
MDIGEFNFGLNEAIPLPDMDDSGRPVPEDIVAVLDSGVRVPCAVRYDGTQLGFGGKTLRRYLVMAEIDWENYQIDVLEIGVLPSDVTLGIRVSGLSDEDHVKYAAHMRAKILRHI